MNKDEAISHISNLYPPDSDYSDTAEIGKSDLLDALANQWRELPESVLVWMAQRQLQREQ